jgi:hypothetical protein
MSSDPNPLEYSPEAGDGPAAHPPRGARTWAVIALVWAVGLASWAAWLGALAFLVVRVLAG